MALLSIEILSLSFSRKLTGTDDFLAIVFAMAAKEVNFLPSQLSLSIKVFAPKPMITGELISSAASTVALSEPKSQLSK